MASVPVMFARGGIRHHLPFTENDQHLYQRLYRVDFQANHVNSAPDNVFDFNISILHATVVAEKVPCFMMMNAVIEVLVTQVLTASHDAS
jgi:hypothetical protein